MSHHQEQFVRLPNHQAGEEPAPPWSAFLSTKGVLYFMKACNKYDDTWRINSGRVSENKLGSRRELPMGGCCKFVEYMSVNSQRLNLKACVTLSKALIIPRQVLERIFACLDDVGVQMNNKHNLWLVFPGAIQLTTNSACPTIPYSNCDVE